MNGGPPVDVRSDLPCATCAVNRVHGYCPAAGRPEGHPAWVSIRQFGPRETVLREGQPGASLMLLVSGWAVAYTRGMDGRRRVIDTRLPGESISYHTLFTEKAEFTVRTLTAATVCEFDNRGLRAALADDRSGGDSIGRLVGSVFRRMLWRIDLAGMQFAKGALASLILDLYLRLRQVGQVRDEEFFCPLTHELIGEILGLTKVHVSRTLKALRDEGCLDYTARRVRIHDLDRLMALSGVRLDLAEAPELP